MPIETLQIAHVSLIPKIYTGPEFTLALMRILHVNSQKIQRAVNPLHLDAVLHHTFSPAAF